MDECASDLKSMRLTRACSNCTNGPMDTLRSQWRFPAMKAKLGRSLLRSREPREAGDLFIRCSLSQRQDSCFSLCPNASSFYPSRQPNERTVDDFDADHVFQQSRRRLRVCQQSVADCNNQILCACILRTGTWRSSWNIMGDVACSSIRC